MKGKCKVPWSRKFYNTGNQEEENVTNERLKEIVAQQPVGIAMHSNFSCFTNY